MATVPFCVKPPAWGPTGPGANRDAVFLPTRKQAACVCRRTDRASDKEPGAGKSARQPCGADRLPTVAGQPRLGGCPGHSADGQTPGWAGGLRRRYASARGGAPYPLPRTTGSHSTGPCQVCQEPGWDCPQPCSAPWACRLPGPAPQTVGASRGLGSAIPPSLPGPPRQS